MVPSSMELGGVRGCGLLVGKAQTDEQRYCILSRHGNDDITCGHVTVMTSLVVM